MHLSLLALYVSAVLTWGADGVPHLGRITLDPWLHLEIPGGFAGRQGWTIPGLVLTALPCPHPDCERNAAVTLEHELGHVAQIQVMGAPLEGLVYGLTLGRGLENYLNPAAWRPEPVQGARVVCPMLTWKPDFGVTLWECHAP